MNKILLCAIGIATCCAIMLVSEAHAVNIPVGNADFESPGVPATGVPTDSRSGWNLASWTGGSIGTYSPATPYPSQDGSNVGYLTANGTGAFGAAFYQDVTRIKEGTYSVSVGVSHEPGAEPSIVPFSINFEAIDYGPYALVGTNDFAVGTFNNSDLTSVTESVTFPNGSSNIGQYLRPVLLASGQDAGANPAYNLDNVQIEFTPPGGTPEPVVVTQHSFDPLAWQRPASLGNSAGEYRPLAPLPNQVGDQLGFISLREASGGFGALFQDVTTIAAGTYTWTIGVAYEAGFEPTATPLKLNFEAVGAGATLLGDNTIPVGSINSSSLTDITVSITVPAGSANIGDDLRLVMVADGPEAAATYLFDNVRLDFTPVPEPGCAVLTLVVAATFMCPRLRK